MAAEPVQAPLVRLVDANCMRGSLLDVSLLTRPRVRFCEKAATGTFGCGGRVCSPPRPGRPGLIYEGWMCVVDHTAAWLAGGLVWCLSLDWLVALLT